MILLSLSLLSLYIFAAPSPSPSRSPLPPSPALATLPPVPSSTPHGGCLDLDLQASTGVTLKGGHCLQKTGGRGGKEENEVGGVYRRSPLRRLKAALKRTLKVRGRACFPIKRAFTTLPAPHPHPTHPSTPPQTLLPPPHTQMLTSPLRYISSKFLHRSHPPPPSPGSPRSGSGSDEGETLQTGSVLTAEETKVLEDYKKLGEDRGKGEREKGKKAMPFL